MCFLGSLGVRFAVFGCGNRQWAATYMAFAQKVQDATGATEALTTAIALPKKLPKGANG